MHHFMSFPLRPLLYAAGAAATAAGLYYYTKKRGDEERTADTPDTKGSCAGVRDTQTDRAVTENLQAALTEAERKYEQVMKSNEELRKQNSSLISSSDSLRENVSELGEELVMMKRFHKLAAAKDINLVISQNEKLLKQNVVIKILEVSLADAKRKYEQAMKTKVELQKKNFDLTSNANVLQNHVIELEEKLLEIQCMQDKMTKQVEEVNCILHSQHDQRKKTSTYKEKLLKERNREQEVQSFRNGPFKGLRDTLEQGDVLLQNYRLALEPEESFL